MELKVRLTDDHPTDAEVRNAALCLIAYDHCICDGGTPEEAIKYARAYERALDEGLWKGGKHSGDCTKTAHTCIRCQIEDAEALARRLYDE